MRKDKLLLLDADMMVYACCFIAEKKIHYGIVDGHPVYMTDNKNTYNKWLKEQTEYDVESVTHDYTFDLLPFDECKIAIDGMVRDLEGLSGCRRKILTLTKGGGDFRTHLATLKKYKGNRDCMPRPVYYSKMRKYLADKYHAKTYAKWEADDAVSMALHKVEGQADKLIILAAVDKDLAQCPGMHINPNRRTDGVYAVTPLEGARSFYKQMLMGDAADNIPGITGIGDKKSDKLLDGCTTRGAMEDAVWQAYLKAYGREHTYTPWWWLPEYDDPEYPDAAFIQSKRKQFPDKERTVPTHEVFREVANLLHMLRTPTDQYQPTIPELKALIEPYKHGVVHHFLGE